MQSLPIDTKKIDKDFNSLFPDMEKIIKNIK